MRILIACVTSGVQTIVYYLAFFLGWTIGDMVHGPTRMTIYEAFGFGAFLKFSIVGFGILMLAINVLGAWINQKRWTWVLLLATTLFWFFFWVRGIDYFKASLFLVSGVIAIYSKFPIEKGLSRLIEMRRRAFKS